MYEYAPKPRRRKEKLLVSAAAVLAAASDGCNAIGLPYPFVYQLVAVACLGTGILLAVRYLLRDYIYRVVSHHGGETPDLVVTELYARRKTVVCRISLGDVTSVCPLSEQARGDGKRRRYCYTAERTPENGYLLSVCDGDGDYDVVICADEGLLNLIKQFKKQDLSDL